MNLTRLFTCGHLPSYRRAVSLFLTFVLLASESAILLESLVWTMEAEAAVVTVEDAPRAVTTMHIHAGSQSVFISDQVGYKFFVDTSGAGNECSYVKTSDGGASWGSPQKVDDQGAAVDCEGIVVHYDRWTPGDTGDFIHILTQDSGSDDLFYNRLDTTDDSLLLGATSVNVTQPAGYPTVSLNDGTNVSSITKNTLGTIFISVDEAVVDGSRVYQCSTSCDVGTNWSEAGTSPQDDVNDWSLLVPLLDGTIMLINRDLSADDIRTRIWSATSSSWSGAWVTVDGGAIENGTYDVQMAAVTSEDGTVYLAYMTDTTTLGTNDDIRTARYVNGAWTSTGGIVTNSARGLTQIALGIDSNTDDVYVAYSARTTAATANTGNIYWHVSTNGMTSWGAEQGPLNTSAGDLWGVDINGISNERLFVSWYDGTAVDIYGDTIADVFGGVSVSATGTQVSEVRASSTDFYTGGVFAFTENLDTRDVTSITISETGTVDAQNGIKNVKLFYENDTTAPYNCASVSYSGSEAQYGSTDANGFSAADGVSAFNATGITVGTTSALCVYAVVDVVAAALDTATLNLTINNPENDVSVSGGASVVPDTTVEPASFTIVRDSLLTQTHYHFRNDNGTEASATSRTSGTEDTALNALQVGVPTRVRIGLSNEGSTSSVPTAFTLEYAEAAGTCSEAVSWVDVGATDDAFNLYNSSNLTDGSNTTDVAVASGGVTDENTVFLTPNGGVRDTNSTTGNLTFATTSYTALEYSFVASTSAVEGTTYCLRVTASGTELPVYTAYPRMTVASDVRVSATSSQVATLDVPSTANFIGGTFVLTENSDSRTVTGITISESGTVDASTGVDNVRILYDFDTSAPYNCASESFSLSDTQFGATDTDGFSSADGTSAFSDSVVISTTSTMCAYVVVDVSESALSGQTLDVSIATPNVDVTVSSGSVSPSTPIDITGSSSLLGAVLTQTHYHFRNDDGSEAGATSATGGNEDTALFEVAQEEPFRLRLQVSNEGSTTSPQAALLLEYGTKITTCENIGVWNAVNSLNAAFETVDTANLTQGGNTTNVSEATGGVTDENATFKSSNGGMNDTSAVSATTTLTASEFIELEYSLELTETAGYDTSYCFRLTNNGTALNAYTTYAELTSAPKRDFKIQRGTTVVSGTSATITAGVDYTAPASTSTAFIRITNTHHTGAGRNAAGGNQNADDVTVYIENPQNLLTSVRFARPAAAINNSRVDWEIVEYIGDVGGDNEIVVHAQGPVNYATTSTSVTTGTVSGVADGNDVVVFITGVWSADTALTDYESMQSTASWSTSTNQARFDRGVSGNDGVRLSYAVVEFTGVNWKVQRVEHAFSDTPGNIESVSIAAVNSTARTFIHAQKRLTNGLQSMANFGHEIWLSSIGVLSMRLDSLATSPTGHTAVVWVIENTQLTLGAMRVQRYGASTSAGAEPFTLSYTLDDTLEATNNASIFGTTRLSSTGTNYPQPIAGLRIASTTAFELWRSDSGNTLTYRVEVVEWPVAELAFRQNYYRFYVDNGSTTPTDAWPPGATDLGDNLPIGVANVPVADGERLRIRMSLRVQNATFPDNNQSFKLQYGRRLTESCNAISSWVDVGAPSSGAIWRGYDNAPADGTTLPSLLLTAVSDVAGTYEEENDSTPNPSVVLVGDDIEYDWVVQHNGAVQRADYCFRMAYADGTPLSVYNNHPTVRTAGYTPVVSRWRWYSDVASLTPVAPLEAENVTPSGVVNGTPLKLRVSLEEIRGANGENVKFGIQYSQYADFSDGGTFATPTSTCTGTSTWCYYDGAGVDNATITAAVISDSESCIAGVGTGCGTHNESAYASSTVFHPSYATKEFEFTLVQGIPRVGSVYYFRMFDVENGEPIGATSSYPSIMTEGSQLTVGVTGLPSGTSTEGITTTATTTPTSLNFGSLPFDTVIRGAHRLSVSTNATDGYRLYVRADQPLTDAYGNEIEAVTGTNASPLAWSSGCLPAAASCFGYHAGDDVLFTGSTRFAPDDSYAALSTSSPAEVMYSAVPTAESHDIVYAISVTEEKPAGGYQNGISYIAAPAY